MMTATKLLRVSPLRYKHQVKVQLPSHPLYKVRFYSTSPPLDQHESALHQPFAHGANDEVARLAASRRCPLTLADLLK
jgi:hypothetical protein